MTTTAIQSPVSFYSAMRNDIEHFERITNNEVLDFRIMGSRAFGTNTESSDFDIHFIYTPKNKNDYLTTLSNVSDVVFQMKNNLWAERNYVGYRVDKFISLLSAHKQTALEYLFHADLKGLEHVTSYGQRAFYYNLQKLSRDVWDNLDHIKVTDSYARLNKAEYLRFQELNSTTISFNIETASIDSIKRLLTIIRANLFSRFYFICKNVGQFPILNMMNLRQFLFSLNRSDLHTPITLIYYDTVRALIDFRNGINYMPTVQLTELIKHLLETELQPIQIPNDLRKVYRPESMTLGTKNQIIETMKEIDNGAEILTKLESMRAAYCTPYQILVDSYFSKFVNHCAI
jgi:predicted nucleotidyltransferase